jgi:hypothetical protein
MKQKFKIYPKLIGILAIFMLISCSKDEFVNHIKKSQNKNEISFEQFKKETGLNNFSTTININPVNQQNISTARLANGSYELSDFDISTAIIKKLESANITSYTFRIYPKEYREEGAKSIFNLLLYKVNNLWQVTIIQFKLTPLNYEQIKQGLTEQVQGKANLLYKGNLNYNNTTSGLDCEEVTIFYYYCQGCTDSCDADQPGGCPVCGTYYATFVICYNFGDGSGGGPGEGIGTVGGDGNNGVDIIYNDPNAPNVVDPRPMIPNVKDTSVDGHNFENDNVPPCQQLTSFSVMEPNNPKIPNLKAKIDEVKAISASSFPHEVLYNFMKDSNGNYATSNLIISDTNNSAVLKTSGYYYGGIHSHWFNLYSMFTWSDVNGLKKVYDVAPPYSQSEVTLLLAVKECLTCDNVVVYALKIDDITALNTKINNDMDSPDTNGFTPKQKETYADAKFKKKHKLDMNYQQLEKLFLENFANAGISIYKANDDLTHWDKLTLSGNPIAPITNTPCN